VCFTLLLEHEPATPGLVVASPRWFEHVRMGIGVGMSEAELTMARN
jgi:hypothetical protein